MPFNCDVLFVSVHVCVHVCVHGCVRVFVCACVHGCVRVCVCVCRVSMTMNASNALQVCGESQEECELSGVCVDGTCVYSQAPDGFPCDDGEQHAFLCVCVSLSLSLCLSFGLVLLPPRMPCLLHRFLHAPPPLSANPWSMPTGDASTAFDKCESGVCAGVGIAASTQEFDHTFSSLQADTIYTFHVTAETIAGEGPATADLRVPMSFAAPTGPPHSVSMAAASSSALNVSWREPLFGEQGGLISAFSLVLEHLDSDMQPTADAPVELEVDGDARGAVVEGLELYSFYRVRLKGESGVCMCVRVCVHVRV